MLEVQKSYQAMLRVLNGDIDFVDIANKNISSLPLKKQVECIVCALGEHAAKIKESVPSTSSNSASMKCCYYGSGCDCSYSEHIGWSNKCGSKPCEFVAKHHA